MRVGQFAERLFLVATGPSTFTGTLTNNVFIPFAGFSVISPMIAALIANDGERQGISKTMIGLVVCTLVVFIAIKAVDLLFIG